MNVYIVTVGEYSDYGILKIFTDENEANAYAAWYTFMHGGAYGGEASAQRWETETFDINTPLDKRFYAVYMDKDGNNAHAYVHFPYDFAVEREDSVYFDRHKKQELFITGTYAKDEEHAIKIANERRGRFIAEGRWRVE